MGEGQQGQELHALLHDAFLHEKLRISAFRDSPIVGRESKVKNVGRWFWIGLGDPGFNELDIERCVANPRHNLFLSINVESCVFHAQRADDLGDTVKIGISTFARVS